MLQRLEARLVFLHLAVRGLTLVSGRPQTALLCCVLRQGRFKAQALRWTGRATLLP